MYNMEIHLISIWYWASLVAQLVKSLPAIWETCVQSLGWEDPLEKGMVTHSSILAWKILGTEEPGGLHSMGSKRIGHDWVTNTFHFYVNTTSVISTILNPSLSCVPICNTVNCAVYVLLRSKSLASEKMIKWDTYLFQ